MKELSEKQEQASFQLLLLLLGRQTAMAGMDFLGCDSFMMVVSSSFLISGASSLNA